MAKQGADPAAEVNQGAGGIGDKLQKLVKSRVLGGFILPVDAGGGRTKLPQLAAVIFGHIGQDPAVSQAAKLFI
jgi:hypothetical protein